jgi:hypothetical protein
MRRFSILVACAVITSCGSPKRDFLEGASGGPEATATEVEATRCTDQRGADTTLFVHNDFAVDAIGLAWVSPQCIETPYPLLAPKTTLEQPSKIGDVWRLSKQDGTLLKAVIVDKSGAHVHVP